MNTDKKLLLAGIGEILWDILPGGKQLGGAPANFAYHAGALGAEGAVVSAIGTDDLGDEVFYCLNKLFLETHYIARNQNRPTGTVSVQVDSAGKPHYTIHENAAWDFVPFTEALGELARKTNAVSFGTLAQRSAITRETVRRFLKETDKDCLRVFDINIRQAFYSREVIEASLALASALKINDEELAMVGGLLGVGGTENKIIEGLASRYHLQIIALTRGERGSLLWIGGQKIEHEGIKTTVVDTVGAGDAFTAAMVLGYLTGMDLAEISRQANEVAAYVCSQPGATPPIPEILRLV